MKQLELQEDQSYLGRVCNRLVSNNTQFKTSLKKILRHLDILEDGDEVVEQEVSLGQEDLGKLRKFLLVNWKTFGMWRISWRECNSPGYTPCIPPAASCGPLAASCTLTSSFLANCCGCSAAWSCP